MAMRRVGRAQAALIAALAVVAVMASLPGSAATRLYPAKFANLMRLRPWWGGEPSIVYDSNGSWVYVVAPQGGPSGLTAALEPAGAAVTDVDNLACSTIFECPPLPPSSGVRAGDKGIGFWASYDSGRTFRLNKVVGSALGGFDTDIVVAPDHTVYVADLEIAAAAICSSKNRGQTFAGLGATSSSDTCQSLPISRTGPSNDREWLSLGKRGELYLTYHEVGTGFPIILASKDRGQTFEPCGSMLDPEGPAGENYSPLAGTLVAKPVIGRDGSIFVSITEPDVSTSPLGGNLNHLYLAAARGGCTTDTVFENYKIFANPDANFTLFNSLAIDGGGVLYAVAAGRTAKGQTGDNVWLFVSRNGGRTWGAPIKVNPPAIRGNVMPAVVGGLRGNQVGIAWYGTPTNGSPDHLKNQWRFYVATSFDGGKRFNYTTVTPSPIHYGVVCTQGVACIQTEASGDRNLADFASIAINPRTGCLAVAFAGDPWNRPDLDETRNDLYASPYVTTQTGGTCLR